MLTFPRVAKCLGYRYTFLFGVLLFRTMSLIFPFSNKITGPIDDDSEATMDTGSGSGFSLSANVSIELDYCGNVISSENSENLVNENSPNVLDFVS